MVEVLGLKRSETRRIIKVRRLPIEGEILVKEGDRVSPTTVVARTVIPGKSVSVNLLRKDESLLKYMRKRVGDTVEKGEIIASRKAKWFGFGPTYDEVCRSPIGGVIDYLIHSPPIISKLIIRERIPVEVNSYIPGYVTRLIENGAIVETLGAHIQGIFGIGGETHGEIKIMADLVLTERGIGSECAGKILVGGTQVEREALSEAVKVGAKGIVVGGMEREDLDEFLGYELGVAVTGYEDAGLTLVLTEGFGRVRMSERTFSLLKRFDGRFACINGATQIRTGVIRPEIIIPRRDFSFEELKAIREERDALDKALEIGAPIRVIQEPYLGATGRIVSLPFKPQKLETESWTRALEVELNDGRRVIISKANVEIL